MNRRKAIGYVCTFVGIAVVVPEIMFSGCVHKDLDFTTPNFSDDMVGFLDEIGETILPATPGSPGAKAAGIGRFMKTQVADCMHGDDQQLFLKGIKAIYERSKQIYAKDFRDISPAQRRKLLTDIDAEATKLEKNNEPDMPKHTFTRIKELTNFGYFTSKIGATQSMRYVAVPGKYEGCIPYKKGDRAWATR